MNIPSARSANARHVLLTALTLLAGVAMAGAALAGPPPANPNPGSQPIRQRSPFGPAVFAHPNGAMACTQDQGDPQGTTGRDLNGSMVSTATMTNQQCRDTCGSQVYRYAGTQAGSYCFCGNDYGRSGPSSACTTACAGDAGEMCGGLWANSVSYATGQQPPTAPPPPANGGQCIVDILGSNYREWDVQEWRITGPATISGNDKIYPMTWTVTGSGSRRTGNGVASWSVRASVPVHLLNKQLANGSRSIGQQESQQRPMDMNNGVFGGPPAPLAAAFQFVYPLPYIVVPATATVATANQVFQNQNGLGYLQGPAKGTVICTWNSSL